MGADNMYIAPYDEKNDEQKIKEKTSWNLDIRPDESNGIMYMVWKYTFEINDIRIPCISLPLIVGEKVFGVLFVKAADV